MVGGKDGCIIFYGPTLALLFCILYTILLASDSTLTGDRQEALIRYSSRIRASPFFSRYELVFEPHAKSESVATLTAADHQGTLKVDRRSSRADDPAPGYRRRTTGTPRC